MFIRQASPLRRPTMRAEPPDDRPPPGSPSPADASDASLVVSVGRYDEAALAELYRRHGGALFALARRVIGAVPQAEEVVQEVFLRLWRSPERFDPERGSLRTFLLSQTHSRSIDLIRSETSRRNREERELRLAAEAGYDIEREVVDLVVADKVRDALKHLDEAERMPILLAYFGGYTYREVAELLDMPEGTTKSRIRTGLRQLRAELSGMAVKENG